MMNKVDYQAAREAGVLHRATVPHVVSARFIRARRAIHVTLSNGVEMTPLGNGLHWPRLDADVLVEGLIHDIYGSRSWMAAQMGCAGGSSASNAKAAAGMVPRAVGRKR